jgi:hypothetical protein
MSAVAILLSPDEGGITLKQFLQIKQVCKTVFSQVDYVSKDGLSSKFDHPTDLQLEMKDYKKIDLLQNCYQGLVIPDGLGHYHDDSKELGLFIASFVKFKSKNS